MIYFHLFFLLYFIVVFKEGGNHWNEGWSIGHLLFSVDFKGRGIQSGA